MKMKRKINIMFSVLLCCMSFVWVSCNKEDIDDSKHVSITQPNITFLASVNGLGDNGYNDNAIGGVLSFIDKYDTRFHLLLPSTKAEAELLYRTWLMIMPLKILVSSF